MTLVREWESSGKKVQVCLEDRSAGVILRMVFWGWRFPAVFASSGIETRPERLPW
jgi:hypothetical protein